MAFLPCNSLWQITVLACVFVCMSVQLDKWIDDDYRRAHSPRFVDFAVRQAKPCLHLCWRKKPICLLIQKHVFQNHPDCHWSLWWSKDFLQLLKACEQNIALLFLIRINTLLHVLRRAQKNPVWYLLQPSYLSIIDYKQSLIISLFLNKKSMILSKIQRFKLNVPWSFHFIFF